LLRALKGIPKQFNAAELDAIEIAEFPGFQIATVTVQPIQIQPHASQSVSAALHPLPVLAR